MGIRLSEELEKLIKLSNKNHLHKKDIDRWMVFINKYKSEINFEEIMISLCKSNFKWEEVKTLFKIIEKNTAKKYPNINIFARGKSFEIIGQTNLLEQYLKSLSKAFDGDYVQNEEVIFSTRINLIKDADWFVTYNLYRNEAFGMNVNDRHIIITPDINPSKQKTNKNFDLLVDTHYIVNARIIKEFHKDLTIIKNWD